MSEARVEILDLDNLSLDDHRGFLKLIDEYHHPCMEGVDPHGFPDAKVVVVGAKLDEKPVGILIARLPIETWSAQIYWVHVEKEFRNQGIGGRLFDALEEPLLESPALDIQMRYDTGTGTDQYLKKILIDQHWEEPRKASTKYYFDRTFNAPWLHMKKEYPKGMTRFPWEELSDQDRKIIRHQLDQGRVPGHVSPFGAEEKIIDYDCSFGIRKDGEVIGWVVTHEVNPQVCRFTSLYIHDEYRSFGHVIQILADAIRMVYYKSSHRYAYFETGNDADDLWAKFIKRRLAPYTCKIVHTESSWRNLRGVRENKHF